MKLTYDPRRNIGYLRFHEKTAEAIQAAALLGPTRSAPFEATARETRELTQIFSE